MVIICNISPLQGSNPIEVKFMFYITTTLLIATQMADIASTCHQRKACIAQHKLLGENIVLQTVRESFLTFTVPDVFGGSWRRGCGWYLLWSSWPIEVIDRGLEWHWWDLGCCAQVPLVASEHPAIVVNPVWPWVVILGYNMCWLPLISDGNVHPVTRLEWNEFPCASVMVLLGMSWLSCTGMMESGANVALLQCLSYSCCHAWPIYNRLALALHFSSPRWLMNELQHFLPECREHHDALIVEQNFSVMSHQLRSMCQNWRRSLGTALHFSGHPALTYFRICAKFGCEAEVAWNSWSVAKEVGTLVACECTISSFGGDPVGAHHPCTLERERGCQW